MNFSSSSVIILLFAAVLCAHAWWTEFELIGADNSMTGQVRTALRIRRNKYTYSIEGTWQLVKDCRYDFDCEAKMYYSSKGNNQFKLLPYKVSRQNCCKYFDSWFWRVVHRELERVSGMPKRTRPLCLSYVKGNYTVRGFTFDKNVLPKFMEPGTYKFDILVYRRYVAEVDSKFGFVARLY